MMLRLLSILVLLASSLILTLPALVYAQEKKDPVLKAGEFLQFVEQTLVFGWFSGGSSISSEGNLKSQASAVPQAGL